MKLRAALSYLALICGINALSAHTLFFDQAYGRPFLRQWLDLSNGFFGLTLCLCVACVVLNIQNAKDIFFLQTPAKRWKLWLVMCLSMLSRIPATTLYYFYRKTRYGYPPDAYFTILEYFPIKVSVIIISSVFINIIFWTLIYKKKLPQPIFTRFTKYTFGAWICEIFFAIIITGFLYAFVLATMIGDVGNIPFWLVMLYVSASLRACFVNRQTALEVS